MAAIKRDTRVALIAKIHVAKKQLAVADDSYRAMLKRVTGRESCSDMTERQLEDVVNEFKRLGFKNKTTSKARRKQADSAQATKIRALWLNLFHLGEIEDSSEAALAAYAKRMAKVAALQWLTPGEADAVIRGLRGWLTRVGCPHPTSKDVLLLADYRKRRDVDDAAVEHDYHAITAKVLVIRRQMEILGTKVNRVNIDLGDRLAPELVEADRLDFVIEKFGAAVRELKEKKS